MKPALSRVLQRLVSSPGRLVMAFGAGCLLGLMVSASLLASTRPAVGSAAEASAREVEPELQAADGSAAADGLHGAPERLASASGPPSSERPGSPSHELLGSPPPEPLGSPPPEPLGPPSPEPLGPPSPDRVEVVALTGEIGAGETLAVSLQSQGITPALVHQIAVGMSPVFDFRYAHAGDHYHMIRNGDGELLEFVYATSPFDSYRLTRDGDTFVAERRQAEMRRRPARIAGVIASSLYDAIKDLGESPQLASDFADVFAWDVDFSRAVQAGDEFRILYERLFRDDDQGQEVFVGPGRILAASYRSGKDEHTAVYFDLEEGRGGYYRADGSSVERQFLRAPVKYSRISSNFSRARLHPILKIRRPHLGIDYAAPHGTPVWAVADGKVIHKGYTGGFGRLVKVRHANGYVSYYGHLSRYASNLAVGSRIQQKQLLGYVGSSGLSTGPHVCFRIKKNGQYVNPTSIQTPAGDPIPKALEGDFQIVRDSLLDQLRSRPLVAVGEAL